MLYYEGIIDITLMIIESVLVILILLIVIVLNTVSLIIERKGISCDKSIYNFYDIQF